MHLTAIKLRGFKSFPDPVELRLEPGVAVVVGPNGSGKSNVADAIVWAAGSLSPSELRAEKPDDVLFSGGHGKPPASSCEVELLFDNEAGDGPLPYSELSVARRLHRGGEGQYLVNRAAVRRLDLVELLADLGLAGGMHSVIGQGRVEEILGSSPERRRELVEEAAGLGRFKRQRHRAELKLARVAIQVERARDLERELAARLRPLAQQATAAERAERLRGEAGGLRARLAALDLEACEARIAGAEEGRTAAELGRRAALERLEAILREREQAEEELADAAGRREAATAALYGVRNAAERLVLRRESAEALCESLRAELAELRLHEPGGQAERAEELERSANEAAARARTAERERVALVERFRLAGERLRALERSLGEREGLPPAARALAEEGERLVLGLLEVEPGYERAVTAALGWRASALLADEAETGLALLERARLAGLGSLGVTIPARGAAASPAGVARHVSVRPGGERLLELLDGVEVVPLGELLGMGRRAVTREGHGYDPDRGELWFTGETAEAVQLELEARRRALAAEVAELDEGVWAVDQEMAETEVAAREAAAAYARVAHHRRVATGDPVRLAALLGAAERFSAVLGTAGERAARYEPALRGRADAGSKRTGELAGELRRVGAGEVELRRAAAEAGERVAAVDVELARLGERAREARARLEAAGAEPAEGDDPDELVAKLERIERRLEALGRVNPLAKEEYEREKVRLDELSIQRADLEASLSELERLRVELTETVERRFAETFAAVAEHFTEVAATLFPGGEGRLRLSEPEDEGEVSGLEVELRPAGKHVARLSLLSGGEKALGAISFLFALFLARPCPFYLLDEVEAALDDANIDRFVALLRRYADRAQFIVVTHQKRTMEAADILLGVTMGSDGVSQIVSRRLPREEAIAAGAA